MPRDHVAKGKSTAHQIVLWLTHDACIIRWAHAHMCIHAHTDTQKETERYELMWYCIITYFKTKSFSISNSCLLVMNFFLFCKLLCGPGWPQTHRDSLTLTLKDWDYRRVQPTTHDWEQLYLKRNLAMYFKN